MTLKDRKAVIPEGGDRYELRVCSGVTINQVRACRWKVLVVQAGEQVYIVPPHKVVKLCYEKMYGQHNYSPYESSTLNLNKIKKVIKPIHFSEFDNHKVQVAAQESSRHLELKVALDAHVKAISDSRYKVDAIIEREDGNFEEG